ncbi:MAG: hypothetical protein ABF904_12505 [Ethanoligenens sp.]
MRQLTFAGFLKSYVKEPSYSGTSAFRKLAAEAIEDNPRLKEPLLLYAHFTYDKDSIRRLLKNQSALMSEYTLYFCDKTNLPALLDAFESKTVLLPEEYLKVYTSFVSIRDRYKNEVWTKYLMRKRIAKLQFEKNITNHHLYTSLQLNAGNFHAFMKHAKLNKLSVANVRRVLSFLENFKSEQQ